MCKGGGCVLSGMVELSAGVRRESYEPGSNVRLVCGGVREGCMESCDGAQCKGRNCGVVVPPQQQGEAPLLMCMGGVSVASLGCL